MTVSGWAFDPDDPSASVGIHVYVDGPAGTGTAIGSTTANTSREDVDERYHTGANHGFSATITCPAGTHEIYVYAIDSTGALRTMLGSKTVSIEQPPSTSGAREVTVGGSPRLVQSKIGGRMLEVDGAGTANGTNINVVSESGKARQRWQVYRNDATGGYTIQNVATGKYADAEGGEAARTANVSQYESANTRNNNWIVEDAGEGWVYIRNLLGYYLNVQNSADHDGANVNVCEFNGTDAQKWRLVTLHQGEVVTDIPEGVYNIRMKSAPKALLDVEGSSVDEGANIQIWQENGGPAQRFRLERNADGSYVITNIRSNRSLDVYYARPDNNTNVIQSQTHRKDNQCWWFESDSNGGYFIRAKHNSLYLDVCDASSANGTNVQVHIPNGGDAQRFLLDPVDTTPPVITDVRVTNVSAQGYTISCKVTDDVGVDRVTFPTWTVAGGQDDLAPNGEFDDSVVGTLSGGRWSFRVLASDHNSELGTYLTHIYAWDAAGNKASFGDSSHTLVEVSCNGSHTWGSWTTTQNPTCEKAGTRKRVCSVCKTTESETVPALGHNPLGARRENEVAATCEADGSYDSVVYCGRCSKELSREKVKVTRLGHAAGKVVEENRKESTCQTAGSYEEVTYCTRCGKELSRVKKTIAKLQHVSVTDSAVAPTCTKDGLTAGSHCKVCGTVLVAQERVAAKGHTKENVAAVAATCTTSGRTAGERCKTCGAILSGCANVEALGHNYVDTVVAPTCTKDGYTEHRCSRCGDSSTINRVAATGHVAGKTEVESEVASTCTKAGKQTLVTRCKTCGVEISRKTVDLPLVDHSWSKWKTVREATVSSEGLMTRECGSCGAVESEAIPKLTEPQKISIQPATVTVAGQTYCGLALTPEVTVTIGGNELVKGTDFTVSYSNNTNAGTANVVVEGMGTYEGAATATFTIAKAVQAVSASDVSVLVGKSASLNAKTSGNGKLTYKAADASIATVSETGVVTGVAAGSTKLTVTAAATQNYKSASKTITVTVSKGTQTITASNKSVEAGKTVKLGAKTSGDGKLTYKSSDSSIATVNSSGLVTGVKAGKATITISAAATASYNASTKKVTVTVTNGAKLWKRLWGWGSLDTASAIVSEGWTDGCGGTVVVARNDDFKDALAGAGLAGLTGGPIVLTGGDRLADQAREQLVRLNPTRIYVAGGAGALSPQVVVDIAAATGLTVMGDNTTAKTGIIRLWGKGSPQTSAALAVAGEGGWGDTAIIATNGSFKDALSAAPISYAMHWPILLASGGRELAPEVIQAMKDLGIKRAFIMGGTGAVKPHVEDQLKSAGIEVAGRKWGYYGWQTSSEIANWGLTLGLSVDGMGYATSQKFPDALAGAALLGKNRSVLLLADQAAQGNLQFAGDHADKITHGYVFGGEGAFSKACYDQLPK